MKSLLTLVTVALVAMVVEERARELANDAQNAIGQATGQAREGTETLVRSVRRSPFLALLTAAGGGYALASILPKR